MNDTEILNAGFDSSAQSPESEAPSVTTAAPQPSQSENPAIPQEQSEPDPAQVLWKALNEDPLGTISFLAQHYGWQPNQQPQPAVPPQPQPEQPDPWQQLVLNVALRMWQSESAAVVKQRAQEDGLELSDNDLQQIFLSALERYAGDIDSAYAAFAYPRLKARSSQKQSQEEKEPESGDLMSSIIMAGYR